MMKKVISLLLAIMLCLMLFACSQEPVQQEEVQQEVQEEIQEEVIEEVIEDEPVEEIVEEVIPEPEPEYPFPAMDDVTFQESIRDMAVIVNLSVNPELEIFVNDNEMIIGVSCMNEDAKKIFGSEFFLVENHFSAGLTSILDVINGNGLINSDSRIHIAVNEVNSTDAERFVPLADSVVNDFLAQQSLSVTAFGVEYNPIQKAPEANQNDNQPSGNGNVVVETTPDSTVTTTYNDDGTKKVETEFNNGYSQVAVYDENGQELSKEEYDPEGNLRARHTYDPATDTIIREELDPAGNVMNTHVLGADGAVIGKG